MTKLKAVFWDVDGTIADTEMFGHRIAFNRAFQDFNLDFCWDQDIYKKLLEVSGGASRIRHYLNNIGKDLTDNKIKEIHRTKKKYYKSIVHSGNIPLRKGVHRLVSELKSRDVHQWIVTTASKESVLPLVETSFSNLLPLFSGYVTSEDVTHTKPHPEAYLKALSLSGVSSCNTLVIEDSKIGLESASQAGLTTLITPSPWLANTKCNFNTASVVINDLGDGNQPIDIIKGPKSNISKVDYLFLEEILNSSL